MTDTVNDRGLDVSGDRAAATPPIVVESSLRPADYFRISVSLVLRNPATLALFVSGPLMWALGAASGSVVVTDLGERLSWLVVLIPAFAALSGSYAAYRPGSSALYRKARWTFADDGILIEQPDRTARAEWAEFTRWRRAADCYLLHTGDRHYVVVAGRDVPADRRADFEALLAARIGGVRG